MKKRRKIRLIRAVLLLVIIVCVVRIVQVYYASVMHDRQEEQLREEVAEQEVWQTETGTVEQAPDAENDEPVVLSKYASLLKKNKDLIGWLSIEGMKIDYPVMQCDDNEYYLHHSFQKKTDKYGCLFVKDIADVNTPGTNFVIYGHNMKDGSMFGDLDYYREKSFYRKHPVISFDTLYEERNYEIIAVFLSQVYKKNEDVFKYYDFYEAETEKEFNKFYKNVKKMSLYDTGVEAEYGDTFLTLSTCAYHVEDGRLAVVAKRVG